MLRNTALTVLALVIGLPVTTHAQDAQTILETAQQRQVERWQGINAYVVDQTMMNNSVSTWFVRTEFTDDAGRLQTFFVPMTQTQIQNRQCDVGLSADELDAFAAGAEMTGAAAGAEYERGMDEAGLPKGMLAATGSDPWNTMDPRVMMGGNAEFLRAAADAKRADQAYDPSEDARSSLNHMQAFLEKAEVLGTETIGGRKAWHLRAEGLNHVQPADDGEYRIEAMSLFVDTAEYVPLSMKLDGTMIADGESQPMTMESIQSDYRQVPGSNMYESYRQVMRMAGMLTPEQEAQMAEALVQLEEFEKQKATMPPQQVAMMESMMGPQMQMLENMARGDGVEFETVIDNIRINPTLTDAMGDPCAGTGSSEIIVVETEQLPRSTGGIVLTDPPPAPATTAEGTVITTPPPAAAAAEPDPEALRAAQQACLQEKVEAAQAAEKKKRGFGRLLSGVSRLAGQTGNFDMMRKTNDIYTAGATADDFAQAAKDLGLTEDDIAACENPL